MRIAIARSADDLADVARLFAAYEASLDVDLAYQGFAAELAALPGQYATPAGALLLARRADGGPLGCVALRPLAPCVGEMKRLYVTPEGRGLGVGTALVRGIVGEAVRLGYFELRLDTLPSMTAAQAMYRTAGFETIPPYYDTPVADTVFMRLRLG